MRIASIVGARPQFIKAAPLSKTLRREHRVVLIHTGQHYDGELSRIFFEQLKIPQPDYNLGVGSGGHGEQTGRMLTEVERVLLKEEPDLVIVHGDTNSTLAGALAAVKLHIKVAHVEAGLRSYNRRMPEEINRLLTDHISDLLFCPSQRAVQNLQKEGIEEGVYRVGDVMLDVLLENMEVARRKSLVMETLGLSEGGFLLLTIHREDNTDRLENLKSIIEAVISLEKMVVFPAHPRVRKWLRRWGLWEKCLAAPKLKIIDPVGYLDMLILQEKAQAILTDSGGMQKEAYFLRTPCLTLREETEWVETVECRWNTLVGTQPERIREAVNELHVPPQGENPYGEGGASLRIAEIISGMDSSRHS
jgi:UDP-N-acetylglucosamine 2-epimerase